MYAVLQVLIFWANCLLFFLHDLSFWKVEHVTTISKPQQLTLVRIKDYTLRVPNKTTTSFLYEQYQKQFLLDSNVYNLKFWAIVLSSRNGMGTRCKELGDLPGLPSDVMSASSLSFLSSSSFTHHGWYREPLAAAKAGIWFDEASAKELSSLTALDTWSKL